ncbi:hypothetical protein ACJX0J_015875, partial [Zea mays]
RVVRLYGVEVLLLCLLLLLLPEGLSWIGESFNLFKSPIKGHALHILATTGILKSNMPEYMIRLGKMKIRRYRYNSRLDLITFLVLSRIESLNLMRESLNEYSALSEGFHLETEGIWKNSSLGHGQVLLVKYISIHNKNLVKI